MRPRPARLLAGVLAAALLSGCSGGGEAVEEPSGPASGPASPTGGVGTPHLLGGLDVCGLPTPAMVRAATGQDVTASTRSLARIPGYDGVVDQCGFGPSFASSSLVVAVGLAPAGARVLTALPAAGRPVPGIGDAARATQDADGAALTFVRGRTIAQLRAPRAVDGSSPLPALTRVARELAPRVPATPPVGDDQTAGRCADVDPARVAGLLGRPPVVSRSLTYRDGSATCAWATGTRRPATVTLSLYTNRQAGPFLAGLEHSGPSARVTGVPGTAFTVPGAAYVVADDGQAVALGGRLPSVPDPRKPLPVTPELTALLEDAASLLR
jgi:hypothetical protein